ncbi:hypothetical protein [Blastomonas sp. CCH11-A4]|uniref:hypothetical protein n=1 Tax=Blastomonas sp. CCH11-A4 TaxID=1768782 RepID=UPI000B111E70|nr:hypothetical protein [Blastomonas sp. CCH11-A4]
MNGHARSVQLGVRPWDKPAACVKGDVSVGTGPYAVSDPRLIGDRPRYNNVFRIVPFDTPSPAVAGPGGAAGGIAVADPRGATSETYSSRKYKVTPFSESSRAVIGASSTGEGAFAVADPRPSWGNQRHRNILRVTPYSDPSGTIAGGHSVTGGQPDHIVQVESATLFRVEKSRPQGGGLIVGRGCLKGPSLVHCIIEYCNCEIRNYGHA